MTRALPSLVLTAAIWLAGCGASSHEEPAAPGAPAASASAPKTLYICHMGADCGKSEVGPGEAIPSCCGKVMVRADTYQCRCGKKEIVASGQPAPVHCDAPMKKVQP